jgi:parallel beta-helix repeat protein
MKRQTIFIRVIFSTLIVSIIFFGVISPEKKQAQAQRNFQQAGEVKDNLEGQATQKVFLPIIQANPAIILCNNQVFDGYTKSPFILQAERDKNPGIQKIIRNCTFKNSTEPGIVINDAQNVLIEGSTFENIRTGVPGLGVHGINIRCRGTCNIDNILIRNNQFREIGADGIQLGEDQRYIRNVTIENNTFEGSEATGENGVDIKGVEGPIYVRGNKMHGFWPCETGQDCSGSNGPAIVVHSGRSSGRATHVIIENNRLYNNKYGLTIRDANYVTVQNNEIFDNRSAGLLIGDASYVTTLNNQFWGNSKKWQISGCISCQLK